VCGFAFFAISTPVVWYSLKPYQRDRISVFIGQGTTQKERYQIEQATIAIGSGGFWGKGLLQGTQNRLQFLPESRTDFIFAVLCEEWGFFGALFVLALYTLLFVRLLFMVQSIATPYVQFLAFGLLIHLLISALINICMVIGLLPIVGIPLPLMSYGLSNLLISCISLGWIQGIYTQHL
jgi:rod shape determining protein RodA